MGNIGQTGASDVGERVVVVRCSSLKVEFGDERAICHFERMFRGIGVGLRGGNRRVEAQRNGQRFIAASGHSLQWSRESYIVWLQADNFAVLRSGILEATSKFRERCASILNAL